MFADQLTPFQSTSCISIGYGSPKEVVRRGGRTERSARRRAPIGWGVVVLVLLGVVVGIYQHRFPKTGLLSSGRLGKGGCWARRAKVTK